MVQALSVSTGVPSPVGETFAADQFLISEQNSAIFDLALLAPTLISSASTEDAAQPIPATVAATANLEGLPGEASVEMPTGSDAAIPTFALTSSKDPALAAADKDVALALSALAALEQTSRSPLIAQKARADLLPASLKTRFGNDVASTPSAAMTDMPSDSAFQSPFTNFVSLTHVTQDAATIQTAAKEIDSEAVLTTPFSVSVSTTADEVISTPLATQDQPQQAPDTLSFIDVKPAHPVTPETPASSSIGVVIQPVTSEATQAKSAVENSDVSLVQTDLLSHEDRNIPAFEDAPREGRPSFIGELIETPKPIILPNQPMPVAPPSPLADPASHVEAPAFVFKSDSLPLSHSRDEMWSDQSDLVISNPILERDVAPSLTTPLINPIGIQKKSEDGTKETDQNPVSNPVIFTSSSRESSTSEEFENVEKTTENRDLLTDSFLKLTTVFDQKLHQNLSLDASRKISAPDGREILDQKNIFSRETSTDNDILTKATPEDVSEMIKETDPSFMMMGDVMVPQSLASQPTVTPNIQADDSRDHDAETPEAFNKSRGVSVFVDPMTATSASSINAIDTKDNVARAQNHVVAEGEMRAETIMGMIAKPDLLTAKSEVVAHEHATRTPQDHYEDLDPRGPSIDVARPFHENETLKDRNASDQNSQEAPEHPSARALPRFAQSVDQSDELNKPAFNTLVETKTTLEYLNRDPMARLVEDAQNIAAMPETKIMTAERDTNRKSDGADIREVILVTRTVEQSEANFSPRPASPVPASTPEVFPAPSASSAAPAATTRDTPAAPVYASSDNPLFQIQRDRALQAQIIAALKSGHDEVRLSLYPPQLGQVTINLALDGQKVKVGLKTSSREASDLLTTEQPSLSHALQREGFTLEGFDVTEDDTEKHRANGDEQTNTPPIPAISGSSEFSIDITI